MKSLVLLTVLFLALAEVFRGKQAFAVCDINSVTVGSPTLNVTAPFSGSDVVSALTVTIQAGSGGCTAGSLVVQKPTATGSALNNGDIYISSDAVLGGDYINTSSGATETVIDNNVNIASNATDVRTLYALYHVNDFNSPVVSGSYPVDVMIYMGDPTLVASGVGSIGTTVSSVADLSVANTNTDYGSGSASITVDFGSLTQGEQQTFYALVQSTNSYSFDIASDNDFVLEGSNTAGSGFTNTIDYTMTMNGVSISPLVEPVTVTPAGGVNGATNSTGRSHPVVMTIGDVTNKVAGTYTDTLTLTVTPVN